ncbi:MAG: hypothetical protein ACK4YO_01945 [Candidatus Altarchaeaceae archaeon]
MLLEDDKVIRSIQHKLEIQQVKMPKNYKKGARIEMEVVKKFLENGWIAFRIAGSGRFHSLPDVIAIKDKKIYAFQCKSTKNNKIYLNDEYDKFLKFYQITKAECFFAVKFEKKKTRFYKISDVKDYISIDTLYLTYKDILNDTQNDIQ